MGEETGNRIAAGQLRQNEYVDVGANANANANANAGTSVKRAGAPGRGKWIAIGALIGAAVAAAVAVIVVHFAFASPANVYLDAQKAATRGDYRLAAELYLQVGDYKEASARVRDCVVKLVGGDEYADAKWAAERLSGEDGTAYIAYVEGSRELHAGEAEDAMETLREAFAVEGARSKHCEACEVVARRAMDAGDYDRARAAYESAIEADPDDDKTAFDMRYLAALSYAAQDDLDAALEEVGRIPESVTYGNTYDVRDVAALEASAELRGTWVFESVYTGDGTVSSALGLDAGAALQVEGGGTYSGALGGAFGADGGTWDCDPDEWPYPSGMTALVFNRDTAQESRGRLEGGKLYIDLPNSVETAAWVKVA